MSQDISQEDIDTTQLEAEGKDGDSTEYQVPLRREPRFARDPKYRGKKTVRTSDSVPPPLGFGLFKVVPL